MNASPSPTHDHRGWSRAQRSLAREHAWEDLEVDGVLPDGLRGTLYRNGPGLFELFDRPYVNWFDGDAALTAFRIGDSAQGASRILESRHLAEERAAGRPIYNAGATKGPRWLKRLGGHGKNAANVHVLHHQGALYGVYAGYQPLRFDPDSLQALGEEAPASIPLKAMSAHHHRVPARKTTYGYGTTHGPGKSVLHVYALPDAGPGAEIAAIKLPEGTVLTHDVAVTDRHLVWFVHPVRIPLPLIGIGLVAPMERMRYRPERGSEIIVLDLDDPTRITRFHVPSFFHFHFAGAFELGDGRIAADFVHFADAGVLQNVANANTRDRDEPIAAVKTSLRRATVDPARESLTTEVIWDMGCEYPRVDPRGVGRPYQHVWMLTGFNTRGYRIGRIDVEEGSAAEFLLPDHVYPDEPVFVPGDRPGAGWVLSQVHDANRDRSGLFVWDAERFPDEPVARCWLDHPVPHTLHGTWVPA